MKKHLSRRQYITGTLVSGVGMTLPVLHPKHGDIHLAPGVARRG